MHMLDRRFQILLDEARYERLAAEAGSRGVSVGALIREAIDRAFPEASARRTRALERILSAPDMPVPEPADLRAELEEIRGRRRG
jgi:hypothetical protein